MFLNRNKYGFVLILLLVLTTKTAFAQSTDFGAILQAQYEYNFVGNFDVWVKEDLRFDNDFSQYSRSKTSLGFNYRFVRTGIKLSVGFDFANKYTGKHIYRNRYRIFANASYKYTYHNWEFGCRTRFMAMFHDELRGYYNYTPEYYWRNRLQVSYQRMFSRYKYSLSSELYSSITKSNQLRLNTLMFEADVEYRLTKRQYLSVFVRDYRDIYIESDQIRTMYFGIGWRFKH